MLIGRASQGQTQMLTRYGIVMDEALTQQEKFNEILRLGADAFYLAEKEARSATGTYAQFNAMVSDLGEQLGGPLIESLTNVGRALLENKDAWADYFNILGEGVAEILSGFESIRTIIANMPVSKNPRRYGGWYVLPTPSDDRMGLSSGNTPRENQRIAEERAEAYRREQEENKEIETLNKRLGEVYGKKPGGFVGPLIDPEVLAKRQEAKQAMLDDALYIDNVYRRTAKSIESSMSGAFESMIMDGASFKDAMEGFLDDMARSFAKMASDIAARSIMGGIGFGAGGGLSGGGLISLFAHKGGIVGEPGFQLKAMPASTFTNAPRLHSGLMSDEFPAILQKGEEVIPKGGGNIGSKLDTIISLLSQRQTINANIIDKRDVVTRERIEGREGEGWTMDHIQRSS
jgi:hypothetical protein